MKFIEATKTIYRTEGPRGFMRGLGTSVIKNFLVSGTYFSSLYYFEESLKMAQVFNESQVHFIAGCSARAFQSILANPLIVIKTRLEVIGFNEYNSIRDAFRKIYVQEGLGGFMTGIKVSLIRDVPFSGIFYPIYNFCKSELQMLYELRYGPIDQLERKDRFKTMAIIASQASFTANIISCTVTHPLDLIRTRIYFQRFN